jgi:integrase
MNTEAADSHKNKKGRRTKRANGEGSVRKKGGTWYVRIFKNGARQEIATKAANRSEALTALSQLRTKIGEGTYDPSAERTRVVDLYEDLKRDYTINQRRSSLVNRWNHLSPAFGNDRATSVTTPRLRLYIENRLNENAQPATVQRELATLRRMFRLGLQGGKLLRVPYFPTIQVDNVRTGFFERDEFERVHAELPAYLQPMAMLAYWTGWRRGELLTLEWRHVDLEAGTIRLDPGTTKNKQGRLVFLPPEALEVLRSWRESTAAVERERSCIIVRVFHNNGAPIRDFYTAWRSACDRAKVPGRKLHDFRRTAARNYVRRGVNERVAMAILGHKTRSIFDRYNITSEADLRDAAQQVASPVGEGLGKNRVVPIQKAGNKERK